MRMAIYIRVGTQEQLEYRKGWRIVNMAKIKKPTEECDYVIYPLGNGLPLCLYQAVKDKRLDEVKLRNLPICKYKNYCPKSEGEKRSKETGI